MKEENWAGPITSLIVETLIEESSIEAITSLINKYGNGVWALSVTSLYAPHIIRKLGVDCIITNPPWNQLTEIRGSYGELLRAKASELLQNYNRVGQIVIGSDISSVLLYGASNTANESIAYLMPKEAVYTSNSYHGLGKILTYQAIGGNEGDIIELDLDAFQHGRLPCMVFKTNRIGEINCHLMSELEYNKYSKTLPLSGLGYNIEERESYSDYIARVTQYTETSPEVIGEVLDVEKVAPMGEYIRGLFGGEKKKGAKRYAGLAFEIERYDSITEQYAIKLSGTTSSIRIPKYFLEDLWRKVVYRGEIFPYYLFYEHDVLLSAEGPDRLKEFLRTRIIGSNDISSEDKDKVKSLIDELQQPERPTFLDKEKYYVVYRRMRTFSSVVLGPDNMRHTNLEIVLSDACSYIKSDNELKSFYYSTILNYLIYKVIEYKGAFERDQFLRPLLAIIESNLEWTGEDWQKNVARLGKELHQKAPACYEDFIKTGMQVKAVLNILKKCPDSSGIFKSVIDEIDEHINKEQLQKALETVAKFKK